MMIDLKAAQLVLVDLQEGLVDGARTQSPAEVRRGARVLADVADALGIPCLASLVPGAPGHPPMILTELHDHPAIEVVHVRTSFGAFGHGDTAHWADLDDSRTLLIAGVLTEGAVLASAFEAREAGASVHVVLDACAGLTRRTEEAAIRQLEAAGCTTTSVASVVALAKPDLGGAVGSRIMASLLALLA